MSYGTSSICAQCAAQPSISLCEGCQRKFCLTCLSQHRNDLSLELDDLFNRRNELMEIINNHLPSNTTDKCSCFDEINRWRNEMYANIDRIATTARESIRQSLSETSKNVRQELDQVSQDLQQRQKSGGYVEGDLNRIRQQLIKLNDMVQRFNEQIHIDTSVSKNIPWDSLLFVVPNKEKSVPVSSSQNLYSSYSQTPNTTPSMPHRNSLSNTYVPHQNSFSNTYASHQNSSSNTYAPRQNSSSNVYAPYQNPYSNTATLPSAPRSTVNQQPSGRSASISMGTRPLTYTCIGCKTSNPFNENGRNICSVCRCPAPF